MTLLRRCCLGLGLCALAVMSSGCNIPALSYFLFSPDQKDPPSLVKLASDDKDTKVKVAVIVTSGPNVYDQGARVDRELAQAVIKRLNEACKENKENVVAKKFNEIERYKSEHPDWNSAGIDLATIGKELKVNYVIYLEIDSLSLYVPGSGSSLYQGQTDIKIQVKKIDKADDLPEEELDHEVFPESPRDVSDMPNPMQFRKEFFDRVATKICWRFTGHPPEDKYMAQ
jgi:hypothetical protein